MTVARVRAFAPATVANVGPGFDVLGFAVDGLGDVVELRRRAEPGVTVVSVTGDDGRLPWQADQNAAAVAAGEVLRIAGADFGAELHLEKGLPIGSGLGSSSASAVAGAVAANALLATALPAADVLAACVEAEAVVAGRHADNVAPSLLGGLVLVRSATPPDVEPLPLPEGWVAVVTPAVEVKTRDARRVLPTAIPRDQVVQQSANIASLVSACYRGDLGALGATLGRDWATAARLPLVPGATRALQEARAAGALGASISGSGPTVFALAASEASAKQIAAAMAGVFAAEGLSSRGHVSHLRAPGARVTHTETV